MIALLADENFSGLMYRGLLRRVPDLDILRAQDLDELYGAEDPILLEWAAVHDRVIVIHDVSTMAPHAWARVVAGAKMAGVFEVPDDMPIGQAIEDLVLIVEASLPGEWEGQVRFLPL
jgi:hypothetical protein